jgi:integrase
VAERSPANGPYVHHCAALTGCRRDVIRKLRWSDVDLPARRIILRDAKGTKLARSGLSVETVSLPSLAVAALTQVVPDKAASEDLVFCPRRGRVIAINRDWTRVRDSAGLSPDLVLLSLRHSLGTAGIIGGMSTLDVSKMLRHRNPSVTARYVHLAEAGAARLQDRAAATLLGDPEGSVGD